MKPKKPESVTVEDVEKAYGKKVHTWEGNCYSVASAIVAAGLVHGRAAYGAYRGPISEDPSSFWYKHLDRPFQRHGWVKLNDGRILDPTRWSFECKPPYIFISKSKGLDREYDEGNNELKKAMRANAQPPKFEVRPNNVTVKFRGHAKRRVAKLLGGWTANTLTMEQLSWVANTPLDDLEPYAEVIYRAIVRSGNAVFIPIDNRKLVLGEKV